MSGDEWAEITGEVEFPAVPLMEQPPFLVQRTGSGGLIFCGGRARSAFRRALTPLEAACLIRWLHAERPEEEEDAP